MRKLIILCCLLFALPAAAEPMTINGFSLDSPVKFAEPTKLGLDAYSATYPADKPYKEAQLELVVVTYSAEAVKSMKGSGALIGRIARSNFLGFLGDPEEVNKTLFLGKTGARRVYSAKIPRQNKLHVFEGTLKDGSFVMVAIRDFGGTSKVGDLIRSVANTFTPSKDR